MLFAFVKNHGLIHFYTPLFHKDLKVRSNTPELGGHLNCPLQRLTTECDFMCEFGGK